MQRHIARSKQARVCIYSFFFHGRVLRPGLREFHRGHPVSRRSTRPAASSSVNTSRQLHSPPSFASDTIYALSTAPGRAAIAVIRISGSGCLDVYHKLCPGRPVPNPRVAALRKLVSPAEKDVVLDTGSLVLYFAAPKSVTGEDVLELHIHGGPAIVRSVLEAISQCITTDGMKIRAADPGEFTKRAFYNGHIDLTQVEALGESLAAETEQQRRLAMNSASNALALRYEEWRKMLLYARGELEALIDFSEDQHFDESPLDFMHSVALQVLNLKRQIELHLKNASKGELLRSGIDIALLGAPNAGKSSLLNRIVGRDAAIVSTEAGTTRDIVDVTVDIGGWLVKLGDMAGLRAGLVPPGSTSTASAVGTIEREGIRRARQRALQSDLVVVLVSLRTSELGRVDLDLNDELLDTVAECQRAAKHLIYAVNKVDLLHHQKSEQKRSLSSILDDLVAIFPTSSPNDVFCISCKDADQVDVDTSDPGGLQNFLLGLQEKFSQMTRAIVSDETSLNSQMAMTATEAQTYWSASLSVTHRQCCYLSECLEHLNRFLEDARPPLEEDASNLSVTSPYPAYHIDDHKDVIAEASHATQRHSTSFFDTRVQPTRLATPHAGFEDTSEREISALAFSDDVDIVTAAEHLRFAAHCLAKLTGQSEGVTSGADVEDVLGVVFEK